MRGRFAWLLVLMILALAGCYRPAGDAIEPTVAPPLDPAAGDDSALPTTPPLMLEAPTLPPVTIISPTQRATLVIGQPLDGLTPTQTLPPAPTLASNATQTQPSFVTPGLPIGQVTIVLPTSTPALPVTNTPSGLITPTALGGITDECTYIVRAGDNLFRIAVNNNVSLEDMRAANPDLVGEAPVLQPGQILRLPNCASADAPVADTGTPSIVIATTAPISGATPAPFGTPVPAGSTTYTVQRGDTLFSIAQRFNTTIDAIIAANNLTNPNALSIGQLLIIPAAGS